MTTAHLSTRVIVFVRIPKENRYLMSPVTEPAGILPGIRHLMAAEKADST